MSTGTSIEWTDATWNPLRGTKGRHHCVRISPGCKNCYAATMNKRFRGPDYVVGADTPRVDDQALRLPLGWKTPRMVFVCSMTDLFLEAHTDEMIDLVFAVMALSPHHTFQILTKRAERMHAYLLDPLRVQKIILKFGRFVMSGGLPAIQAGQRRVNEIADGDWPLRHVWKGVSCENQEQADKRIPVLLQTPAAVRWVSAEPLLGPIDFWNLRGNTFDALTGCGDRERLTEWEDTPSLDWIVVGGESGPRARPCDLASVRSIVWQCKLAVLPVFVKQLGRYPLSNQQETPAWTRLYRNGISTDEFGLDDPRDLKGGNIQNFPLDLRHREYPRVEVAA